jgi:hypothetical protein
VEAVGDDRGVAEPGVACAKTKPGTNATATAHGNPRFRAATLSRFKSRLKSNRCANADLIVIEAEKIDRAVVLPMEIIDAGTQPPGD